MKLVHEIALRKACKRAFASTKVAPGEGYVYFARGNDELIKVGFSREDLRRRVSLLSAKCERDAFCARHGIDYGKAKLLVGVSGCSFEHEAALHHALAEERVAGEWFRGPLVRGLVVDLLTESKSLTRSVRSEGHRLLIAACEGRGALSRLAEAIGVRPPTVCRWKNEQAVPDAANAIKLEDEFGIPFRSWVQEPTEVG